MSTPARAANVLGALALVLTDRTEQAVADACGVSISTAAALSALREFLDQPSLDQLRRVLGLTPSGAVRLVDRMVTHGLVVREPGVDGRSRAVTLTPSGRQAAERIAAVRGDLLADALTGLDAERVDALQILLDEIIATVVRGKEGGAWICRLCDLTACERADGHCPAARTAAAKYGDPAGLNR